MDRLLHFNFHNRAVYHCARIVSRFVMIFAIISLLFCSQLTLADGGSLSNDLDVIAGGGAGRSGGEEEPLGVDDEETVESIIKLVRACQQCVCITLFSCSR